MEFSLFRSITITDVVVITCTALFLLSVGLVCMLRPGILQRMAVRAYEQGNPRLRRWLSLPPEIINSRAFTWNLRIGGFVATSAGIALLLVFVIAALHGVKTTQ